MSTRSPKNRFLRLCTAEESRQLDHETIHSFGIKGEVLMEIAGMKAFEIIQRYTEDTAHGLYICGKGNNAGDAFVIARYCSENTGHIITILLAAGDEGLSPDAEQNLSLLKKLGQQNDFIRIVEKAEPRLFEEADYIIDGMIGTGLSSDVREPFLTCIKMANSSTAASFALDIPTGLECNTGLILGECVHADHTITFGTNKIGFYLNNGSSMTGKIHFAELPFPEHLRKSSATLILPDLATEFPQVQLNAEHKYQKGVVHVIAGSAGMTGAAIMSAKSAWKAGAGAVILYSPQGLLSIYEQTLPEIIKVAVGSKDNTGFKPDDAETILTRINEKPGTVLLGPGLGRSEETGSFIRQLLENIKQPVILDADGLAEWKNVKKHNKTKWIITPHSGELKNSVGIDAKNDADRLKKIQQAAETHSTTILSKGFPTLVASAESGSYISGYDTRIFAKAGFGDVLAGTIAGKLAVNRNITESVLASMLDNLEKAQRFTDPEPRDIYDR